MGMQTFTFSEHTLIALKRFCGREAANRQDLRKAQSSCPRTREVRVANRHLTSQ
jgi:hypothetical protein